VNVDRLATRVALVGALVGAIVLAIVTVGVMRIGGEAFMSLLVAAGESAAHAQEMFDRSVTVVVVVAAVVGAVGGLAAAVVLGRRVARPLEDLADVAGRTAAGDLDARATVEGPSEVQALARSYNALVDRLAEQEEIRREFIVNASHELRTPLTNLQGYLEALRDGVMAPSPAVFDSLREEVDRLTRLAASLDLLIGGDGDRARPEAVDLAAALATAIELAAPAFARRSITIDAPTGSSGQELVAARPDEVAQVLSNLLQNALRYTPPGGRVRASVEPDAAGREVTVRVANSGPGIPPDEIHRVWERFYRVDKSRARESGGAGVGLAIVKRIVEEAGGRVGATSMPGETTFWFSLPRATA